MIRYIISLILLLGISVAGLSWWFLIRPLPPLSGLVNIVDLQSPVKVSFDQRQIPYLEAQSQADLYLAQGYLTARDRIFQMDILRRTAEGKLAEIFGAGALSTDKLMRTIGCARLADSQYKELSAELKAVLSNYSSGVNSYLSQYQTKLPVEFSLLAYRAEPWRPADSLAVMNYLAFVEDESWRLDDLRQRMRDKIGLPMSQNLFLEPTTIFAGQPALDQSVKGLTNRLPLLYKGCLKPLDPSPTWGSTCWAISGKRSQSGKALLACDKDQALTNPDLWHLISLSAPGLHVAGATIPGIPGILIGRNEAIGWGSANLKADVQDLFLEEFSDRFPDQYRTTTGWHTASHIVEEIPVRFQDSVIHNVTVTDHGPVLLKDKTKAIALSWAGHKTKGSTLSATWLLNRAQDWSTFQDALRKHVTPAQLFVFADRDGNVGCHAAGDIPVRCQDSDGCYLALGWTNKGQWQGQIPFADLPSSFNPISGYVIAANHKLIDNHYRWLIGHQWADNYRARRVQSYCQRLGLIGLADMNEMQADQFSYLSPLVRGEIMSAMSHAQIIDQRQLIAVNLLKRWDGSVKSDSAAAGIYESFVHTLAHRLFSEKLGISLALEYMQRWPAWPLVVESFLSHKPSSTFILTTFAASVKGLQLRLEDDNPKNWLWEKLHPAIFTHNISTIFPWLNAILNVGPIGIGGDGDTIDASATADNAISDELPSLSGTTMRLLIDMADADKFYQSLSLGQSGQSLSPAAHDQLQAWLHVDPLPLAFSHEQLDKQCQHVLILTRE